jgi:hypothetical protein
MVERELITVALLLGAAADVAADPTGLWWAEGGAGQVEVRYCGETRCGRVASLRSPLDA